jgi:hypothetical protein
MCEESLLHNLTDMHQKASAGFGLHVDRVPMACHRSREMRLLVKLNPEGVVIVRHGRLNYFHAPHLSFIPPAQSQKNHYGNIRTIG